MRAIELSQLVKYYGSVRALAGIDLAVESGQIFGFLGPNGAGKTTVIRILLDLIRPTSGEARVLGLDSRRDSLEVRRRVGYLPGDLRLYEDMRGTAFLDLIDSFRPEKRDLRYRKQVLERLDLDASVSIRTLSKGNKQKLGLAQALVHRPDVLVLDEPTSGLDPLVQHEVAELMTEAANEGRTVFFSSHVLSEVERLAHTVALIREGLIAAVEDIADLRARAVHMLEVTFDEPPPAGLFALPGITEVHRDGNTVQVRVRDNLDAAVKAISRHRVLNLRTEQPSLEDFFLAYYSEEPDTEGKAAS